ncbi:hypothetical protein JTE90_000995 [Oedothorax gibbosus]|uniref:Uncharacterized protein n=1 Tax=Oedothorax gibbosus TaxID=931172 RepID=A0AAV6TP90_9ARAC|nr:hypothetical protein JTE90_000995 [Oedothorax gibbosus]
MQSLTFPSSLLLSPGVDSPLPLSDMSRLLLRGPLSHDPTSATRRLGSRQQSLNVEETGTLVERKTLYYGGVH